MIIPPAAWMSATIFFAVSPDVVPVTFNETYVVSIESMALTFDETLMLVPETFDETYVVSSDI